jgi:hypothetical protein
MAVADARDAVLIPSIRPGAGVVMGEVFPGCAVGTIVFANCSPGALTDVRPPALPVLEALARFLQADVLFGHGAEGNRSAGARDKPTGIVMEFESGKSGGDDGARTRDLCRDREEQSTESTT